MPEPDARIVVVGCGPVGMTLANLLGTYGVPTLVLERGPQLFDAPRAVGTDFDCLRAWQAVGLDEKLLADMIPSGPDGIGLVYRDVHGRRFMEVRPRGREYGFAVGYGFIQPLVDRVLLSGLERFPHVQVRFGRRVDGVVEDAESVVVSGQTGDGRPFEVRAAWVVACDGGRSTVRRGLGIAMHGPRFAQRWLVLDTLEAETAERNVRDVNIWCDAERPAVCVPRLHGHRRWEFLAHPDESDEALLSPATIRRLLAPHTDPDAVEVIRKVVHTFRGRVAERYRAGRVLLAGDAAHVTPPFAGQGMAIGIRDASNLAWKLALVSRSLASPAFLDSYQLERRPGAQATVRLALRLGRVMTPGGPLRARLVPAALRLLGRIPRVRAYLLEGGPRPKPRHRDGWYVASRRGGAAGAMAHQPFVRTACGERVKLDRALGPGFAMLGIGCNPIRGLAEETRTYWRERGTRFLRVRSAGDPPPEEPWIEDLEGGLQRWLGGRERRLLLVRPDRYVACDVPAERAEAALADLRRRLDGP
ncbi:MAG: bifunctional 3-(3-hydroxy-phenyl)propionate/3-hydroxycinnamic acid hydroxylase [Myxococcota bacterium]